MMAGHANRKKSVEIAKRLAASGVAALEIGVPHSDPLADGPVIQKAGQTALDHGMTVDACLGLASEVSGVGAPVVLMSYVNPILAHDPRRFAARIACSAFSTRFSTACCNWLPSATTCGNDGSNSVTSSMPFKRSS